MTLKAKGKATMAIACLALAIGSAFAPMNASAVETKPQGPIVQRLVTDEVLDTYKSFSTANYPSENIDCYAQTYRVLSFKTSYSRTGQTILYTSAALSPRGNGMPGFETKYKCTYRTW